MADSYHDFRIANLESLADDMTKQRNAYREECQQHRETLRRIARDEHSDATRLHILAREPWALTEAEGS